MTDDVNTSSSAVTCAAVRSSGSPVPAVARPLIVAVAIVGELRVRDRRHRRRCVVSAQWPAEGHVAGCGWWCTLSLAFPYAHTVEACVLSAETTWEPAEPTALGTFNTHAEDSAGARSVPLSSEPAPPQQGSGRGNRPAVPRTMSDGGQPQATCAPATTVKSTGIGRSAGVVHLSSVSGGHVGKLGIGHRVIGEAGRARVPNPSVVPDRRSTWPSAEAEISEGSAAALVALPLTVSAAMLASLALVTASGSIVQIAPGAGNDNVAFVAVR